MGGNKGGTPLYNISRACMRARVYLCQTNFLMQMPRIIIKMKNKIYSRKHEDFLTSFSFTSVEEADFEREETESAESAEELL